MSDRTGSASAGQSAEQLQRQVEEQREQLAGTIDALSAKLDVKAQAQAKVAEARRKATTPEGKPRPELLAAGAAVVLMAVAVVWWRHR
jgi:hypothetical protein